MATPTPKTRKPSRRHLRGFASMDPARHRALASAGGRAAQAQPGARRWTAEEAAAAGRKGGRARVARWDQAYVPKDPRHG